MLYFQIMRSTIQRLLNIVRHQKANKVVIHYQFFLFHYTVVESFSIKIVAGNGGYETCRPRAGSQFNIISSGIYLSSISSRDQAADYDLKNMVQHKRHRGANVYSELSHGQKVICVEENCGHNKRRKRS
jgi:hypothetical protein